MSFFRKKYPFSRRKFLMTFFLFLDIDQVFQILRFFTVLNVVCDPFFTRKTTISQKNSLISPFFTLFVLSRTSYNTTSLNIGGTNAWAVPAPQFFCADRPHSPHNSLPLILTQLFGQHNYYKIIQSIQ